MNASNDVLEEQNKSLRRDLDLERTERKEGDAKLEGNQNWLWRTIIALAAAALWNLLSVGGAGPGA